VGIDLHIHSTASDGTLSPAEILATANKLGLGAISITDHDSIDGTRTALHAQPAPSIDFITGIEISADFPGAFAYADSCHILGYGFDPDHTGLNNILTTLQSARQNRNPQIIERLRTLGFHITLQDVENTKDGPGQLGRPHIARAMVAKGFARSIDEAFDKYLANGQPAYVDKYRLDCAQAINVISRAGGIPVLAHPCLLPIKEPERLEMFIVLLKTMGLKGIEVFYPEHDFEATAFYKTLAKRHDLLMTGGSDFHGEIKPDVQMGSGKGDMFIPYDLFEALRAAVKRHAPAVRV
jgi:predicted metal-dependent phosphoesterase TrpH